MDSVVRFFQAGGFWMWPLLLLGIVGGGVTLLLAVLGSPGRRLALAWGMPALVVATGAAGWLHSVQQVRSVLGLVDPAQRSLLTFAGSAEALVPMVLGLLVAGLLLALQTLLQGASLALGRPVAGTRTASSGGLLSAGAATLGLAGCLSTGVLLWLAHADLWLPWFLPLVLLSVGLGQALAWVGPGTGDPDRIRGAAAVAASGVLAVGAVLLSVWLHLDGVLREALVHATPSSMPALVLSWSQAAGHAPLVGLVALALALAIAGCGLVPAGAFLGERSFQVQGGAALLVLLPPVGLSLVAWNASRGLDETIPSKHLSALVQAVPRLPLSTADHRFLDLPVSRAFLWDGSTWSALSGWPTDPQTHDVLAAAPATTPASALLDGRWNGEKVRVATLPASVGDLSRLGDRAYLVLGFLDLVPCARAVLVEGDPAPEGDRTTCPLWETDVVVTEQEGQVRVAFAAGQDPRLLGPVGSQTPPATLQSLREATHGKESPRVLLVPGPSWTFQTLVDLCEATPDSRCLLAQAPPPAPASTAASSGGAEPGVTGTLGTGEIQKVIRKALGGVRSCYELGLRRSPTLQGTVTVRMVIGRDGSVTSASVASTTLGDGETEECIVRRLEKLQFPAPQGGEPVVVSYPFAFTPG